jgi:hypothetical protein
MRRRSRAVNGVLAALALGGGACTVLGVDDYGEERDRLEEARREWRNLGWDSYAFTLRRLCFCGGGTDPAEVVVLGGERVSVTVLETGEPVPAEWSQYYLTVEELFDFIEDAIERKAHEIEIRYERATGLPASIRIDYIENAIDEEMAFEASGLRALR